MHRSLPALSAGRFYVYGRQVTDPPPPDLIALQVEAALAFGSGHHESTQGCLELLSALAPCRDLHRILDMGCGSGIWLWPPPSSGPAAC
ncbi:MAG: 50S ribosomal protein L11 methyltransferase [Rhodospirillales bacterium]|nr:50S ribosomal protein L11 methyltransferase [Rhodospirillales bacterium]